MYLQRTNQPTKNQQSMRMAYALCNEECFAALVAERQPKMAALYEECFAALVAERQPKMAAFTANEGYSPSFDFEERRNK
jgi:hypothetical protein